MTLSLSAFATVAPHFMEPEAFIQYTQASGFTETLADRKLRIRLASDDLFVYARQFNLRTKMSAGAASFNELPGVNISGNLMNTQTYLLKCRSEYDHHDIAEGSRWGISTVEAYRKGMRQANNQLIRDACLKGMNPQNGEGLVNAANAVSVNLPPDPDGNTTASTYDNGAMAFFLNNQVQQLKTATLQLGIGREFTLIGPQRILGQFEYNVVQLTQFQREGAGTTSTAGVMKEVLMQNGDKLVWTYDDTLIGAGAGGTDMVILIMPELAKPQGEGETNTNEFASLAPSSAINFTQYADKPAPTEIMSPMAGGKTDFVQEMRISSGWPIRGAAIRLLSMPF